MTGYQKALELLHKASGEKGFTASISDYDNYNRVWTRDGVVTGLAALMTEDKKLINTFKTTLQTIFDHQHATGFIPSNVDTNGKASYGGTVGRADNPSWAIIGLCQYALHTKDFDFAKKFIRQVDKCIHLMNAWEYNGKHLLYVPQSGDWADEYFHHGYILFDQLLRVWALRLAAEVFDQVDLSFKADKIIHVIQNNFWNSKQQHNLYAANLKHQLGSAPDQYWFLGFNPAQIYDTFDLQANSLALLLGIGDPVKNQGLVQYLISLATEFDSILPSFYPAIGEHDWHMNALKNNYAFKFRNKPNEFHNGGLWPVWNGFLITALKKFNKDQLMENLFDQLCKANELEDWQFNECLHGISKRPVGAPFCVWSAAGLILAHQSIEGKQLFL